MMKKSYMGSNLKLLNKLEKKILGERKRNI